MVMRHRTALSRAQLSMPSRLAVEDGLVRPGSSVLDFGSGRGGDVSRLRRMDVDAAGWDPHFAQASDLTNKDVVLLIYVLNVIENHEERLAALRQAWQLTDRVMVVSSRLTWERQKVRGLEFADGTVTSRQTFQKLFEPAELRGMVEQVTGARVAAAAPGVVYAFRHDDERLQYLARKSARRSDWLLGSDETSALASAVDFYEQRGRLPAIEEYPADLLAMLSHLSVNELRRLLAAGAAPSRVEAGRRRSILDTLLLLGLAAFSGRPKMGDLPTSTQLDIRAGFTSYKEACSRADRLLLKLRDDTYVRGAMRNSVGKMTPTALYVHRRALNRMPVVLRLYEHCGAIAGGRPDGWDILKLNHAGRRVAWSSYPGFDTNPHPVLAWSYSVAMPSLDCRFTSYEGRENRPILHRKEEFIEPDDDLAPRFTRLTAQEVRAGLYTSPELIGLERGWEAELRRCGVGLRGHRLVRSPGV